MRADRRLRLGLVLGLSLCGLMHAQLVAPVLDPHADSDHDGLSDALEQDLLAQFLPTFMIGEHDCSTRPAEFRAGSLSPTVQAENGTIYGQVFPARSGGQALSASAAKGDTLTVELHYYDLWQTDCGPHGHALDTEHVAVLVQSSGASAAFSSYYRAEWEALYWYAAAHEDTVCDASQITRASTLHAEDHGATVWISPGKHAAYLNGTLCQRGCGADRCEKMTELVPAKLINLGEVGAPMNGSVFIASSAWPLLDKMSHSNFPEDAVARVDRLSATDIAWFHPGRHPIQGVIARSSSTEESLARSEDETAAAISVAGNSTSDALSGAEDSTDAALSNAGDSTGNALQKCYRNTKRALGVSVRGVGRALHVGHQPDATQH